MRTMRRLSVMVLGAALVVPVAVTGTASASAEGPRAPTLVGIRAAHHPGYDRIVFDFDGGLPASRQVRYVDRLIGDPSGLRVPIAGRAILQVRFYPANAHDDSGGTAPETVAFPLPNIMTAVRAGDSEAVTIYGIGLAKRQPFRVFTLTHPDRVVIDIDAAFRTVQRRVWFLNVPNYMSGHGPYFTSVLRPVLPMTPATGVMDRLFAGPTTSEMISGLRLLPSQATGWRSLWIRNGIARVRLVGGCNSGGSTVSIANEISPTLKQFARVDHVKIYDPSGHTEVPTGPVDSIPVCLEP